MAPNETGAPGQIGSALSAAVARNRGLFIFEGIVLLVLGTLALLAPFIATLAATVFFGVILLASGVTGLIATLRSARTAPGYWWALLSALTGILAGIVLLVWPLLGAFSLTTVLIAFLFIEGVISIMYALEHRKALSGRWGWMLASGIADVVLGLILLLGLPGSALWALGVIMGINMIFGGWALIAMATHARSSTSTPAGAAA
jgi:uncharacterized membrane protein HdeD (DUF308 family)